MNIKKIFSGAFTLFFILPALIILQVAATNKSQNSQNNNVPPKISVLMPVYNCEKYLEKSLNSVLNQTFKDIELICVNDGSKDNSLEILKEYSKKDSRLVLIDQKNQGAAAARQNAINKARGEYIAFVDADDVIDENAYEVSYEFIKKYDADILCFGWKNFSDENKSVIRNDCKFNELKIYDNWYEAKKHRGSIYLWNKLYKRSLIVDNNVTFSPEIKIAEDEGFNLCAYSQAKKIVHIPYTFYNYRVNSNSLMCKTSTFQLLKNYFKMLNYVKNYYKAHNIKLKIHKIVGYLTIYKDEIVPLIKTLLGSNNKLSN